MLLIFLRQSETTKTIADQPESVRRRSRPHVGSTCDCWGEDLLVGVRGVTSTKHPLSIQRACSIQDTFADLHPVNRSEFGMTQCRTEGQKLLLVPVPVRRDGGTLSGISPPHDRDPTQAIRMITLQY